MESYFKVKAKILCLIKEYRNTNGQNVKAVEENDSLNENWLNYKLSIRLKATITLSIFLSFIHV